MADLTDHTALSLHRARAARMPVTFLHEAVAADIEERLAEVKRTFTAPAIVTGHPDFWRTVLPRAQVVADKPVLALLPEAHDLVLHAMSLHWADDPVGQLVQCRRALRPDGLLIAVFPGGRTLTELRTVLADAEIAETGGLSPRVVPMAEVRAAGALLQRAGLALPVADTSLLAASYPSLRALMHDLRGMGETNALAARLRRPTQAAIFARATADYAARYPSGSGRIAATFEILTLTGWAPGPGQQQPLRPGSAAMRLADALGTAERPLGERADPSRD